MTFVCLLYRDETPGTDEAATNRVDLADQRAAFEQELRRCGHFVASASLAGSGQGVVLGHQGGRLAVSTDCQNRPGDQLAEVLLLEARDLNHAIQLASMHPFLSSGRFEIRLTEPRPPGHAEPTIASPSSQS